MLTEKEKSGAEELLRLLPVSDLHSLAQTVTSNMLVLEDSAEAIAAILLHTDKAVDLLKRKKIKKESLFKYLHAKRVPIEAVAEKSVHMAKVLEVWGTPVGGDLTVLEENSLNSPPVPVGGDLTVLEEKTSISIDLSVPGSRDQNHNRRLELELERSEVTSISLSDHSQGQLGPVISSEPATTGVIDLQCQELAVSFVRWFYHLLNTSVQAVSSDWNSSHFWPDASAKVSLLSQAGEVVECLEEVNNSEAASMMLLDVIRQHKLQFNPNLCLEGVRGTVANSRPTV